MNVRMCDWLCTYQTRVSPTLTPTLDKLDCISEDWIDLKRKEKNIIIKTYIVLIVLYS